MKILCTGSSGMIGTALVEELKKIGHEVVCVDRLPGPDSHNTIVQDLTRKDGFRGFPDDVEFVIHLAANARVYNLVKYPVLSFENIEMIFNMLEWTRANGVKNFLFSSSRECYGNQRSLPVSEEAASQRNSESSYTASKIAGEAYIYAYRNCYDIDARIIRLSNVYGKYDQSDRFIPKLIRTLDKNEDFEIYGIRKTLDFTYIDDCIQGVLTVVKNWNPSEELELNIASGTQTNLFELAVKIRDFMKSNSNIIKKDNQIGEVWNYRANIKKMKSLGWFPEVDINEGIIKSIMYYAPHRIS